MSHVALNLSCERVRATEHAPGDPFRVFERRHCLAEIVERSAIAPEKRLRVKPSHPERGFIILTESASRRGGGSPLALVLARISLAARTYASVGVCHESLSTTDAY